MGVTVLYDWPTAANFGRAVPKTKFYEHCRISSRVRGHFVSDVARINWSYKLADETVHLGGTAGVPEIQVFSVELKDAEVSPDVLIAIDKAIPFPIIFEVVRGSAEDAEVRMTASYKRISTAAPKLSDYFTTAWLPANTVRAPLPAALDLANLYSQLLRPLLPVPLRPGESLDAATSRLDQAKKLKREAADLERRLRAEPQLSRKVELRRKLVRTASALTALIDIETR